MKSRLCVIVSVLGFTLGSAEIAAADWLVSPFVGPNVGGRTVDAPKIDFGVAAGWSGSGPVGVEIEASRSPHFFEAKDVPDVIFSQSSVTTVMVNAVVKLPGVPGLGRRLHPYATAGAGLVRSSIGKGDDFIRGISNDIGLNVGAGATWMFGARVGARGDLRYVRDLQTLHADSDFFSFGSTHLDYWRVTAGVVLHF